MFEILSLKQKEWNFVGKRRVAFVFSLGLVLVGLTAVFQIITGRAPMGIDFAGGLAMTVHLEKKMDIDEIRKGLAARGVADAQIQQAAVESGQRLLIKIKQEEQEQLVRMFLEEAAGKDKVSYEGIQVVGPAVGKKLREQATWAVTWAIILITIYIWIRFEYRFGIAAAVATAHDVLAVLGLMWLLDKDFTLLTVTALLTIAGYSLTDTVVVFDRIRENMRLYHRDPLENIINRSINEVLSRTIVTSMTTLFPLVALLVYGSQVTFDFSLALTTGIFIGTYSSWFIASPIIVEWELRRRRQGAR